MRNPRHARATLPRTVRASLGAWSLALASTVACSAQKQDGTGSPAADAVPHESPGCGKALALASGEQTVTIAGKERTFLVRLPEGYDTSRPYPLIFGLHGAGGNGLSYSQFFPLLGAYAERAIFAFPSALFYEVDGRTTWRHPTEENLAFFDAMVEQLEQKLCVDQAKVFASGFSSGGFFSNTLGCRRGKKVSAIIPVAGGDRDFNDQCEGYPAVLVISSPQDSTDPTGGPPGISHHERGIRARDHFRAQNGCMQATVPALSPGCVQYEGCRSGAEVFYCEHEQGHAWPAPLQHAATTFLAEYLD